MERLIIQREANIAGWKDFAYPKLSEGVGAALADMYFLQQKENEKKYGRKLRLIKRVEEVISPNNQRK